MKNRISVITICYNAAALLPVTIESVLAQDYDNFEYIIQDGNSSDNTADIIESYRERFAAANIDFVYNKEADDGIYDAMNKGVRSAGGRYINFMNAGDCFYNAGVLSSVAEAVDKESGCTTGSNDNHPNNPTIVYGDCAVYEYGRFYRFPKSLADIESTMPFSHQSVFADSDFLRQHPFDTGYRYSADYDFLLTANDLNEKFLDAGIIVCITTADGLSSVKYHDTLMESVEIQKKHGVFKNTESELAKEERILRLKQFVLDHFPTGIKKWIRGRQIASRGQGITVNIPPWFADRILR